MDSYLSSVAARSNPRTARFLFSSSGNSPSGRHFTLMNLLCITLYRAVYSRLLENARKNHLFKNFFDNRWQNFSAYCSDINFPIASACIIASYNSIGCTSPARLCIVSPGTQAFCEIILTWSVVVTPISLSVIGSPTSTQRFCTSSNSSLGAPSNTS